jgi:hypothetical protein
MQDGISGRMDMVAAVSARVGGSADNTVVIGYSVAFLAVNSVRIEALHEPAEAGCIIREFILEVLDSKVFHPSPHPLE